MRSVALALLLCGAAPAAPATAQAAYERFSLNTTAAIDVLGGDNVSKHPQVVVDVVATARLGNGWQAFFRPWFRQARPTPGFDAPPWDAQIYQASLRYERSGPVSTRVDIGYMPSPVGLGIFDVNPKQNPTIAGHFSYFVPMLPFDTGSARVPVIASTYPLAAVVTASTTKWDARAALTNSSPVRISIPGVTANPDSTPVFEAGAGVTPIIGLRLGVSFAHGAYLTASEFAPTLPQVDRRMTLAGIEGEYAFRYTKLTGEVVHDTFATISGGEVGATTWFVQGTQTLAPRWYVAGRHEGTTSPVVATGAFFAAQPTMLSNELTAGFRVNRDITLKASYYTRRPYGRVGDWDRQAGVQAVWDHRWW